MFSSDEVERFWPYIQRSVDRIVQAVDSVPEEDLDWQLEAADSNSLYALAAHALGNLEEQLARGAFGASGGP